MFFFISVQSDIGFLVLQNLWIAISTMFDLKSWNQIKTLNIKKKANTLKKLYFEKGFLHKIFAEIASVFATATESK